MSLEWICRFQFDKVVNVATMLYDEIETDSLVKLNVELHTFIDLDDDNEELTTKNDIIENNTKDIDEFLKPLVQELSGIKRDKYPLNNADAAYCKDDIKYKESLDNVDSDKPEDVEVPGQETFSSVAAISYLRASTSGFRYKRYLWNGCC